MSIQSPVSIVFENSEPGYPAVELVGEGGWLVRLPDFTASQEVVEKDGILRSAGFSRPLGAVTLDFDLEVEVDMPSTMDAQQAFLDGALADLPMIISGTGTLTVTAPGEAPVVFPDAVVSDVTPELPSGAAATLVRTYHIKTTTPL
jgi:hypothetical protein